ncbi:MAG: gliding motility protein GldN [Bacteroidales bacterium]
MKRLLVLFLGVSMILAVPGKLKAQDLKKEVYDKIHIPNKKPIPYVYSREADMMWTKTIWRKVDLRQKMNLPLYYPLNPIGTRMNLVNLLFYGIDYEGLKIYDAGDQYNEFKQETTKEQVDAKLGVKQDSTLQDDPDNPGNQIYVKRNFTRDMFLTDVKQIWVKEKWFFDRNYSTLQVRIVGLCPVLITPRLDASGQPMDEMRQVQLFWVYYPEARNLLSSHETFNRFNDAQAISFDDLFMQRRFDSFIYRESNVYDNRLVSEYTQGIESLLESEKIKEFIRTTEHDLWEY